MFYGNKPQDTRQLFFSSWQKYLQKKSLSSLETQIVDVIIMHPEYQPMLEKLENAQAYSQPITNHNPFLHMGLHLALRDQIAIDRPAGIRTLYQQLLSIKQDVMVVEHLFMECLEECLWRAQQAQCMPDEEYYLKACENIVKATISCRTKNS